jgi:hypothetical protein
VNTLALNGRIVSGYALLALGIALLVLGVVG